MFYKCIVNLGVIPEDKIEGEFVSHNLHVTTLASWIVTSMGGTCSSLDKVLTSGNRNIPNMGPEKGHLVFHLPRFRGFRNGGQLPSRIFTMEIRDVSSDQNLGFCCCL